jgi:alkylated DNA repair dioxygenase AlkB
MQAHSHLHIPGLYQWHYLIGNELQKNLVSCIDEHDWTSSRHRRVQQYGFLYDYQFDIVRHNEPIGELPLWLANLGKLITECSGLPPGHSWNQAIVNEYIAGESTSKHIDSLMFGEYIASVSLLSQAIFRMTPKEDTLPHHDIVLKPGDLLILMGQARYLWTHQILPVQERRLSITFRTVEIPEMEEHQVSAVNSD